MNFIIAFFGVIILTCIFTSDKSAQSKVEQRVQTKTDWAKAASVDSSILARERKRINSGDRLLTAHEDFNKFIEENIPELHGCEMFRVNLSSSTSATKVDIILMVEMAKTGKFPSILTTNKFYTSQIQNAFDAGRRPTVGDVIALFRYVERELSRNGSDIRFVAVVDCCGEPTTWCIENYYPEAGARRMW